MNMGKMKNFKKNEIKIMLTQNQNSDVHLVLYDKYIITVLTSIAGSGTDRHTGAGTVST